LSKLKLWASTAEFCRRDCRTHPRDSLFLEINEGGLLIYQFHKSLVEGCSQEGIKSKVLPFAQVEKATVAEETLRENYRCYIRKALGSEMYININLVIRAEPNYVCYSKWANQSQRKFMNQGGVNA
jgi:hypothetical protein